MTETVPAIEFRHVSHEFGDLRVLEDVSFQVEWGERVALIGPSGAGKSTAIALMNGTLVPTSGEVYVLGHPLRDLGPRQLRHVQRQIGTVYQHFHLIETLAVIHNVNAGHLGKWSGLKSAWSLIWPQGVAQAVRALARVGIADKLYTRTDRLSGGQQQRVALARVLVQQPQLILADEPIASLDPERSRELMDLLRDLGRELSTTLLVSLHAVSFARSHCDRLIGLRRGCLQFDLPAAEVTDDRLAALYRLEP